MTLPNSKSEQPRVMSSTLQLSVAIKWLGLYTGVKCKKKKYLCHFSIIAEDVAAFLMSGPSASQTKNC